MFDVTPDDIALLNDTDLRELVARLCEAELRSRGLSPAAVTWGGNQTAADGGLDVRVSLPGGAEVGGFISRTVTGFQVKKPDMPRTEILREMRPAGAIRPIIQTLADEGGAYIIVSSTGSTADARLEDRKAAMREALHDVTNNGQLHIDFFDRTRLATWVRGHAGIIAWVRKKVGRGLVGWQPHGPWSGTAEDLDAEYLLDDKIRLHFGRRSDTSSRSVADALDELRDMLARPGGIVRLVGLSGVGKTRLVQALFDERVGTRPLPPSLAIYTNLSDQPAPVPAALASDLVANKTRAILIVDNCSSELHRRLTELCAKGKKVSVLTVEYDVREDQPEGTQVVQLDTSSPELIEKLVRRRYPDVSHVDSRRIAEISGGNARIAIALAETVGHSETLAGFSNKELFDRLFHQGHTVDPALLLAAEVCSLVYSFQGESLTGEHAELPRLAALIDQRPAELYRHVREMTARDLVQRRGDWRAVLPHALANHLAARALEGIPFEFIDEQLVAGASGRLSLSFSRRLSFLHDSRKAIEIVERWLSPGGLLGDVNSLNEQSREMFINVAPVMPEATISALERAGGGDPRAAAEILRHFLPLLRSLAYDPLLFERSAGLIACVATKLEKEWDARQANDTFLALFPIYLSGTHATITQRLRLIETLLLIRDDDKYLKLGLSALDEIMRVDFFGSAHQFDFGARPRDYGYAPQNVDEIRRWYISILYLIERLYLNEERLRNELCKRFAHHFRALWGIKFIATEIEALLRKFARDGFWRDGWAACRQSLSYDRETMSSDLLSRLLILERELRPATLGDRVRAIVLRDNTDEFDVEDLDEKGEVIGEPSRPGEICRRLGEAVANDPTTFTELLPELLRGSDAAWAFGRGLASGSPNPRGTWNELTEELHRVPQEHRNVQVLRGFLAELWERDRATGQNLLDDAFADLALLIFIPVLQTAVPLDARGVERLKRLLSARHAPAWAYRSLALGSAADHVSGHDLKDLLLLIADLENGFSIAVDILHMRLFSDRTENQEHDDEMLEAGRNLLARISFEEKSEYHIYRLERLVKTCLTRLEDGQSAANIASKLKKAVEESKINWMNYRGIIKSLLEVQPVFTLDSILDRANLPGPWRTAFSFMEWLRDNPADVIRCEALVEWCRGDPETRYLLAAHIITFARQSEEGKRKDWSEQAATLLANAPDPMSVLDIFIKRFRPTSWSGSRAAIMEANAQLLEYLPPAVFPPQLPGFLAEAKAALMQEIVHMQQKEEAWERTRDERFE